MGGVETLSELSAESSSAWFGVFEGCETLSGDCLKVANTASERVRAYLIGSGAWGRSPGKFSDSSRVAFPDSFSTSLTVTDGSVINELTKSCNHYQEIGKSVL